MKKNLIMIETILFSPCMELSPHLSKALADQRSSILKLWVVPGHLIQHQSLEWGQLLLENSWGYVSSHFISSGFNFSSQFLNCRPNWNHARLLDPSILKDRRTPSGGWRERSNNWKTLLAEPAESRDRVCVCVCVLVAQLCLILCDPMDCSPPGSSVYEFSRQEYWSGLPFPSPGHLPESGIKPMSRMSPALAGRIFTAEPPEKPLET